MLACLFFSLAVWGLQPGASHVLGMCAPTGLHPQFQAALSSDVKADNQCLCPVEPHWRPLPEEGGGHSRGSCSWSPEHSATRPDQEPGKYYRTHFRGSWGTERARNVPESQSCKAWEQGANPRSLGHCSTLCPSTPTTMSPSHTGTTV